MRKRFLTICRACIVVGISVFGFANLLLFPDQPLGRCDGPGGYCGKHGEPHTAADFYRYRDSQMALFVAFAVGLIGLVIIEWKKPKD
ncbi:MAG TPA: hypothetical protein VMF58_14330 [Rhizomicrobium sp.]|nr:hypothetical protein [Rhizomicrobium sp.]